MYSFNLHNNDVTIPFFAYGLGFFNERHPNVEDPIDVFWDILSDRDITYYGNGTYSCNRDKVIWLIERNIPFSVDIQCKDFLSGDYMLERVTYMISIRESDALLMKLTL